MTDDGLPTVFFDLKGQHVIRLTPTALLCWWVRKLYRSAVGERLWIIDGNTPRTTIAMVRELRRRQLSGIRIGGYIQHAMNAIDAPPCACGKQGLYIVNATTYCRACKPQAEARRAARGMIKDRLAATGEAFYDAASRVRVNAEKHRQARGRRRGGFK